MGDLRTQERTRQRLIIALSGLPGTGKTTLARALASALGAHQFSFGDHVRRLAIAGDGGLDRANLQAIGDAAVSADPDAFVRNALADVADDWSTLIIDGVRHKSVYTALQTFAAEHRASIKLVHLHASEKARLRRLAARGESTIDARTAIRHATERDVQTSLPLGADIRIRTDTGTALRQAMAALTA